MRIVAIIQARMGSTRFPGKVMELLGDTTILSHVVSRVAKAKPIHQIVIATSDLKQDNVIQKEAERLEISCYRGNETNVLERYHHAATLYEADMIIRITADCPFIDFLVLSNMIEHFLVTLKKGIRIDYLSNCIERTYPRGLDVELFTMHALKISYLEAKLPYQQEHVTPYIYQHPDIFSLHHYLNPLGNYAAHRWTLDTIEDFVFIKNIYARLENKKNFTMQDILVILEKEPWLVEINSEVKQKEIVFAN